MLDSKNVLAQGRAISSFLSGVTAPYDFEISFGNPDAQGVFFCDPPAYRDPTYCQNSPLGANNEQEYQAAALAPNPPSRRRRDTLAQADQSVVPRQARKWKTASGINVTLLSNRTAGDSVFHVRPLNHSIVGTEGDTLENWQKLEDTLSEQFH